MPCKPYIARVFVVAGMLLLAACGTDKGADSTVDAAVGDSGQNGLGADTDGSVVAPDGSADTRLDAGVSDAAQDTDDTDGVASYVGAVCSTPDRSGTCLEVDDCDGDREAVAGHCPGPTNIQCCVPEQEVTTCNPDASYEDMPRPNAGLTEQSGSSGCPTGMVQVDDFCIDRYEAALVEVLAGGSERSWSPYFNPGSRKVRAVSIEGAIPQGHISGEQAAAACGRSGKRLCTDQEWLRACRGPAETTFPYGDTRQPGVCNDAYDGHPVVDYFETSADWIWSELGNACINQQADTVAAGGAHAGCETAEGVFDMMGNVHEWTAATDGVFRGGFYADTERNGPGCLYRTTAHNRQHWDYSTGFRCCADPR